ncbi:MAG: FAD-dependent oxidoreductase [Bacilli bacterium]
MYDCIIIGMGPAGMSAAVYAKRSGLKVLCLEKSAPGGLINSTNIVDNFIGYDNISGPDLAYKMFEHILNEEIEYKIEEVIDIENLKSKKIVKTVNSTYETKTIIICTGRQKKKPNIEKKFNLTGKGISYCAICDAALYKNKPVAVIGGGNSAFEEGVYLANICSKVYIINRNDTLRADEILINNAKACKNIEIIKPFDIETVNLSNDKISSVVLNNKREIDVKAIFVYIGFEPMTDFLNKIDIINDKGYIEVSDSMRTNVKGIYACGDAIDKGLYQIVTAASDGAIAATSAKKDISGGK